MANGLHPRHVIGSSVCLGTRTRSNAEQGAMAWCTGRRGRALNGDRITMNYYPDINGGFLKWGYTQITFWGTLSWEKELRMFNWKDIRQISKSQKVKKSKGILFDFSTFQFFEIQKDGKLKMGICWGYVGILNIQSKGPALVGIAQWDGHPCFKIIPP